MQKLVCTNVPIKIQIIGGNECDICYNDKWYNYAYNDIVDEKKKKRDIYHDLNKKLN